MTADAPNRLAPAANPHDQRRVWITQEPMQMIGGVPTPRIPYHSLAHMGSVHFVFGWGEVRDDTVMDATHTKVLLDKARMLLADFRDDDVLLPMGNPGLIAIATLAASEANDGRVTVLDWLRNARCYRHVMIDENL